MAAPDSSHSDVVANGAEVAAHAADPGGPGGSRDPGAGQVVGRKLVVVALVAAVVGALLTLSFAYADHAPTPHGVKVAVVGPAAARSTVAAGLAKAAPGAFTVLAAPSTAAAEHAIRTQHIRGALVLEPDHKAKVLTAGAAGLPLLQVVQTGLTAAATAGGDTAATDDLVPPTSADANGLLAFVFGLGLLVPSVIGSVGLYLIGLRSRVWVRAAASALFAVAVAGLGTLVLTTAFSAFGGHWLALWGVGTLGALAFVLSVAAAQATFGLPGTGLAGLLLIFVGNATSGGSVPTEMLPSVYRQISPWLPNGGIVHAVRAVVYFGGHGLGQPLVALAAWAGGALLVLLANDFLHLSEALQTRGALPQIYATPGVAHVAHKVHRHRAGVQPSPAA